MGLPFTSLGTSSQADRLDPARPLTECTAQTALPVRRRRLQRVPTALGTPCALLVISVAPLYWFPSPARAQDGPTPLRTHIRMFINGGRDDAFLADRFDFFAWGNLNAKYRNPAAICLLYAHFGTLIPGDTNRKYQALLQYCDTHGLSTNDLEDMFLHTRNDVDYTLLMGSPGDHDPPVTRTVPGWDPVNDPNGDGYVDDDEFQSRPNPNASARTKGEARIPIYFWGPPADYLMNIGHPDYVDFLLGYALRLLVNNEVYNGPAYWNTQGPVSVVPEPSRALPPASLTLPTSIATSSTSNMSNSSRPRPTRLELSSGPKTCRVICISTITNLRTPHLLPGPST